MKHKVIALNTYKVLGVQDKEHGRIMDEGEEFEVSEERLNVLLGKNAYKKAFVKLAKAEKQDVVEEETLKEEVIEECAPVKKSRKKNK